MRDRLSTWSRWWALAVVWWTLNGFASATNYRVLRGAVGDPVTWGHALATSMTSAVLWVPLPLEKATPKVGGRQASLVQGWACVSLQDNKDLENLGELVRAAYAWVKAGKAGAAA